MAKTLQHQIIARALELISDESKWTRGAMARNAYRWSCPVEALEAVRFCAVGAIRRAAFELLGEADTGLVDQIEATVLSANGQARTNLASINDREGRERIVAMFEKALIA
jgi:hypothetical protein